MSSTALVERAPMTMETPPETWHQRCVICGGSEVGVLVGFERAHLVRCRWCGMVFAARIPTDGQLAAYYQDYGHSWHDSPITRKRYAEILDSLEPYRDRNRLLDVGCGAGYFLEEARRRGWEVHGTEYSGLALDLARAKDCTSSRRRSVSARMTPAPSTWSLPLGCSST